MDAVDELYKKEIADKLLFDKFIDAANYHYNLLDKKNIFYSGGKNSPYIWLKCPNNLKSWEFFDMLLTKAGVVGTPGAGFGKNGEGYFR